MKQLSFLFAMVLIAACFAVAQNGPPPPPPPPEKMMFFAGDGPNEGMLFLEHMDMHPVKGAPYTATATTESTQVLADGNRIVHSQSGLVARDSEGRTRREQTFGAMGPLTVNGGKSIVIHDPVAKSMIVLNPEQKTAHVMKHNGPNTMKVVPMHGDEGNGDVHMRVERMAERGDVKKESLGTQTIEGVAADGVRVTRTIPAGAVGNEQPIVITTERWTSPDLHTAVLVKRSDPRFGESTFKLTNIKLGEPDSSLFQVPSGFTTEQGPMKMKLRRPLPPPPPGE